MDQRNHKNHKGGSAPQNKQSQGREPLKKHPMGRNFNEDEQRSRGGRRNDWGKSYEKVPPKGDRRFQSAHRDGDL